MPLTRSFGVIRNAIAGVLSNPSGAPRFASGAELLESRQHLSSAYPYTLGGAPLPDYTGYSHPASISSTGYPAGTDWFSPFINSPIAPGPILTASTASGEAGDVVAITGEGMTEGATSFVAYGQTNYSDDVLTAESSMLTHHGRRVTLAIDSRLPEDSMYFIWPKNASGYGAPVAVNRTEAWWGTATASIGETASVYGKNLTHSEANDSSHVYLQPLDVNGQPTAIGMYVDVASTSNGYKVDYVIPAGLPNGKYQVWVHNGHGGKYGWSMSETTLTVETAIVVNPTVVNVTPLNDGLDLKRIQFAIDSLQSTGGIVQLAAGTFRLSASTGYGTLTIGSWNGKMVELRGSTNAANPTILQIGSMRPGGTKGCISVHGLTTIRNIKIDATNMTTGDSTQPLSVMFVARMPADVGISRFHLEGLDIRVPETRPASVTSQPVQTIWMENANDVTLTKSHIQGLIFINDCTQVTIDDINSEMVADIVSVIKFIGCNELRLSRIHAIMAAGVKSTDYIHGRFIVGDSGVKNCYIADNTSDGLYVQKYQNAGEQIGFEGTDADHGAVRGHPVASTPTTVTLSSSMLSTQFWKYRAAYVIVYDGTGTGQVREVKEADVTINAAAGTVTIPLDSTWTVKPETDSWIAFTTNNAQVSIYRNTLDTRPGSGGVVLFSGGYKISVDSNEIKNADTGVWVGVPDSGNFFAPNVAAFTEIRNNSISNAISGIYFQGSHEGDGGATSGAGVLGVTVHRNHVFAPRSSTATAISGYDFGFAAESPYGFSAIADNTFTDATYVLATTLSTKNPNSILYGNRYEVSGTTGNDSLSATWADDGSKIVVIRNGVTVATILNTPLTTVAFNGSDGADQLNLIGKNNISDSVTLGSDSGTFDGSGVAYTDFEKIVFNGRNGGDSLSVSGGAQLRIDTVQELNAIDIGSLSAIVVPNASTVLTARSLNIADTGHLNLGLGTLILDWTDSPSPYTTLLGRVVAGVTNAGRGISTGLAGSSAQYGTAMGIVDNVYARLSTVSGRNLPIYSIVMKYTWVGDANLDGVVDGNDTALTDTGFATHKSGWYFGDFDLNGTVDGSDYGLLDTGGAAQTSPL